MKLGDIIAGGGSTGAYRAPTKSVKFKVLGENSQSEQVIADARAELRFVPEDEAVECRDTAERVLRKKFADAIPADLLLDERAFQLLQRALRDADDPRQPFAASVTELRSGLQRREANRLVNVYEQWVAEEFPEQVDDDIFEQLVEEAKKKSLADLLSSHESSTILRALPSLVAHFGKSPMLTSGDGELG